MRRIVLWLAIAVIWASTPELKSQAAAAESLHEAVVSSQVTKVEGTKDLFLTGAFFIGGQPNLDALKWLRSEGVTVVVNLRSEKENKEFTESSFNEESVVRELGMAYHSIPLGEKESFSPQALERLAEALRANRGKALIHCQGAGRATHLWMAYLVRYRGFSLDEAVAVGKQIKFTFPLEDLLGARVRLSLENPARESK